MTEKLKRIEREYDTPIGVFSYQRIKKPVYTGYSLREVTGGRALLADPEKALSDYLYFVDLKKISLNDRLNLRDINRTKLVQYVSLFQRKNMLRLIDQIYVEYRKPSYRKTKL